MSNDIYRDIEKLKEDCSGLKFGLILFVGLFSFLTMIKDHQDERGIEKLRNQIYKFNYFNQEIVVNYFVDSDNKKEMIKILVISSNGKLNEIWQKDVGWIIINKSNSKEVRENIFGMSDYKINNEKGD